MDNERETSIPHSSQLLAEIRRGLIEMTDMPEAFDAFLKIERYVANLEEQYQALHKSTEQALAALEDDGILWISAAAILRAALHNSNPAKKLEQKKSN